MARKRQLNPRAAGDYDKRLGELVRLRRKELGMSQSDLGAALGVSFQQIQKQERGVNRISAATLQKIAIALKAPLSFFQPSDEAGQAEVNTLLFKNAGLSLRLAPRLSQPSGCCRPPLRLRDGSNGGGAGLTVSLADQIAEVRRCLASAQTKVRRRELTLRLKHLVTRQIQIETQGNHHDQNHQQSRPRVRSTASAATSC